MLSVCPKETASMVTRDGVRLDADVYRPDADGPFPVLLMRQHEGRAIASTRVYAHPTWYAAHGYIVIIQDVRGRGTSGGKFVPFAQESQDGLESIAWAAEFPGSTGAVGMYGFSYQGMTQLYAAAAKPPALKAICPAMVGADLFRDWAYEGGAFCLHTNLSLALQMATETARLQGDALAYQALYKAFNAIPLHDPIPARPEVLQDFAVDSFYHQWLNHPEPDEYWEALSPHNRLTTVDLPMLHIGGWFDTYLRGTIRFYREVAARSAFPQQLLVGPWVHFPWNRRVGTLDYGPQAVSPADRLQIRWFDEFLKDLETGLLDEPPISLFQLGSNRWNSFDDWPDNERKSYFLASQGGANLRNESGSLVETYPAACPEDIFVHDPLRPAPAQGGHAVSPAGPFERSIIDCRSDVAIYTSQLLATDLHLAGDVTVSIWCEADTPSFDLCAVLSEVRLDGTVYNLTQGYVRIKSGQTTSPLRINLQPVCARIDRGKALRLSLSAACFPAYPVNSGTEAHSGEEKSIDAQPITVTIRCGGDCPSQVLLPIVSPY